MKRVAGTARPDWRQKVEAQGFTYYDSGDGEGTCWDEAVHYEFTEAEIDAIEAGTNELHRICLGAVDHVCRHPGLMDQFAIPPSYRDYVLRSWRRRDPHWMGRFDLAYDPATGAVKMLEYNADTPTMVIETAVVQWFWLQDTNPTADQFNSLHERLIERMRQIGGRLPPGAVLHFAAWDESLEETQHATYFMDLATQAGISCKFVPMRQVGWASSGIFVDQDNVPIRFLHKLYPWEWLAQEEFGPHLPKVGETMGVLEPPWKMLLSNKAILPLLWELNPGHPNLLVAAWDRSGVGPSYVRKPILAREGANIEVVGAAGGVIRTGGSYGDSPVVYQDMATLPRFGRSHAVIGSWVVGDEAAGMILREDESPVVVNSSKVVPHLFAPAMGEACR